MQIDELRAELSSLADEISPFEHDVAALHRHNRRRRVVSAALVVAFVVALGAGTVAFAHTGNDGRLRVTAGGTKEVAPTAFTHVDAIVVPASPAVRQILEASPLVGRFALIPRGDRFSASSVLPRNRAYCALRTDDGYLVAAPAATPVGTSIAADLGRALTGAATVYDVSDQLGWDFEVFMQVGTSPEYGVAVQTNLRADPDVASRRVITPTDAYAIFKKDFASEPALVDKTKPSDLPESFRVVVRPGRSVPSVIARYRHADGVDVVIDHNLAALVHPTPVSPGTAKPVSLCAEPGS